MDSESLAVSCHKASVFGLGHALILVRLVKKISSGEFVELADLLFTNLGTVNLEPHHTWMENFWFPKSVGCLKLRASLHGKGLLLSTR